MPHLQVLDRLASELSANPGNARTHSVKQIRQIATSIQRFGFNNPVLIDAYDTIIAGHGRVEAAKILGLSHVPTITLEHLTESQKRAYIIADNRIAELAGWDKDILAIELQNLIDSDADFEVADIGFETADVDLLLMGSGKPTDEDSADIVARLEVGPPISRLGDLWLVSEHRVFCGNALVPESYEQLMGGEKAQMIFTDPPYNVPIGGHVSGLGKVRHGEFKMASGEMTEAEFTRFLSTAFKLMANASCDGAIHFVCMDWRHLLELLRASRIAYSEMKNLCVWAKENGGMGSLYRSQHELIGVFKNGDGPHINNVELGRHGRYRTNVWTHGGMNGFQAGRDELLAIHPTVKPVGLVADAILDCSHRRGIILDPFAGSGTTIIAAARTGRRCFAMEFDPLYVDAALRRVRAVTGLEPVCAKTGTRFSVREAEARADSRAKDALDEHLTNSKDEACDGEV